MSLLHIHWLKNHRMLFTDMVSHKPVYLAECRCGKMFTTDTLCPFTFFKVESK